MSEKKTSSKMVIPPKSPPIPIRSVRNSFFPEPRTFTRLDM